MAFAPFKGLLGMFQPQPVDPMQQGLLAPQTGFMSNPNANMLLGLGGGLLAHRQNAMQNPLSNAFQAGTQGAQVDALNKRTRSEEAREMSKLNQTAAWAVSNGFAKDIQEGMVVAQSPEILNAMLKKKYEKADPLAPIKVGKGETLLHPETYEPIYQPPSGPGGLNQEDLLKREGDLRSEFSKSPQTKRFDEVHASFKRVRTAAADNTPAGDIGLIFGFMKMNDPTSTVREGEVATVQNAAGIPDRLRNLYNNAVNGERLSPQQRAELAGLAQKFYDQEAETMTEFDSRYDELARQAGVSPDNVTTMNIPKYEPIKLPSGASMTPTSKPNEFNWGF